MGIGSGTLLAGLFGMNVRNLLFPRAVIRAYSPQLRSHIEENEYAFFALSALSVVVAAVFSWRGLTRCAHMILFATR